MPQESQDKHPTVTIAEDNRTIVISGLPEIANLDLQTTSIMRVVHQVKKLFSAGDRFGRKGYNYRRKHQLPLEQPRIRIQFAYTCTRRADGCIAIGIWWNSVAPAFRIVDEKPLSKEEIQDAMDAIVRVCANEIELHLADTARHAKESGHEPDYYNGSTPAFYGEHATVPSF